MAQFSAILWLLKQSLELNNIFRHSKEENLNWVNPTDIFSFPPGGPRVAELFSPAPKKVLLNMAWFCLQLTSLPYGPLLQGHIKNIGIKPGCTFLAC